MRQKPIDMHREKTVNAFDCVGVSASARHVRKRCFTLLELLIVVGIIGVLATMLFPVVSRSRSSAQQTLCISNLKQVHAGVQMYSDPFPCIEVQRWPLSLTDAGIFDNPLNKTLRCPGWRANEATNYVHAYGMRRLEGDTIVFGKITNPSNYVLFADSLRNDTAGKNYMAQMQVLSFYGNAGPYMNVVHYRHNRKADAAFADGSVRACELKTLSPLGCPKYKYAD